jgi:hypothetical protein
MKLSRVALLALLLACLSVYSLNASDDTPNGKIVESPYYPLKVNTTWTYKTNDGTKNERKLVMKVTKHEKVGNTLCALIESSVDGKVIGNEYVGVNADGICRFKVGDGLATPPLCFLKLPPGMNTWKTKGTIKDEKFEGTFQSGKEEVEVPLGTYQTVTAKADDLDINGIKGIGVTYYFAKDIGMVKQIIKLPTGSVVLKLEAFESPK